MRKKQIIDVKVIQGEPHDGSGRVCIHLSMQDVRGPYTEPCAMHPVFENGVQVKQKVECHPTRSRLACDPKRVATTVVRRGVISVTHRTDDPRAVTCPKCIASEDYKAMVAKMKSLEVK